MGGRLVCVARGKWGGERAVVSWGSNASGCEVQNWSRYGFGPNHRSPGMLARRMPNNAPVWPQREESNRRSTHARRLQRTTRVCKWASRVRGDARRKGGPLDDYRRSPCRKKLERMIESGRRGLKSAWPSVSWRIENDKKKAATTPGGAGLLWWRETTLAQQQPLFEATGGPCDT